MCVYFNRIFKNRIIALIVILCELLILAGVLYWKFVMYCIVMYTFVCLPTSVCVCVCVWREYVVSLCVCLCVCCVYAVCLFVGACICVFVYMCVMCV